jgi:microcystin-dependent protein
MKKTIRTLLLVAFVSTSFIHKANASVEPYIGEIMMFGGNFCPRGWSPADGQLLQISSHSALFSVFGTTYGGDGRTTFGLPDLRNRAPVHVGNGPGLGSSGVLGSKGGSLSFTLTAAQLPSHNHSVVVKDGRGVQTEASGKFLAEAGVYRTGGRNNTLNSATIGNTGGGQAVNHRSPYQVVNFCIALTGTFPPRS